MRAYIIKRVLLAVPTLFIVSLIIFVMVRLIPGSVVDAMVAQLDQFAGSDVQLNRASVEKALGLDVPIIIQYGRWWGVLPGVDGSTSGLLQGDLGNSLWRKTTVVEDIAGRWPVTIELGILALIVAQLIALPVGVYSALRQDTGGDYIARSFAILCIAVPGFWLGTLVVVFPSIWWGYMAPIMKIPFFENPLGNLQMFIAPSIVLGMVMSGATMRITRTMMLEVLRQDYIRTAWAKGLKERVVVIRHVLKNALIPVITTIGWQLPVLLGGTVIIEEVFNLAGMGRLMIDSVTRRDYPVVAGIMLLFSAGMVLINLIIDLTYAYLDPRVRYR